MSLFLVNTAFTDPNLVNIAKIGIIVASILAATIGVGLLNKNKSSYDGITLIELPVEQPA